MYSAIRQPQGKETESVGRTMMFAMVTLQDHLVQHTMGLRVICSGMKIEMNETV
jgi:hypothetical protein